MSFLAPLFLVGLALLAGPILFHMIRQAPRNRVIFSSTELLDASEPKTEKSRRIQNPWLLLIRCLIVALLAFAFARPFLPDSLASNPSNEVRRDVIIAIDQSLSMNRPGVQSLVMDKAQAIIETLGENDQLSVFGFADTTNQLISSEQWNDLPSEQRQTFAQSQLQNWNPTSFPGWLDLGLSEAVSKLEDLRERTSGASYGEIFLLSDFSEGTNLSGIELIEWPKFINLARIQVFPTAETPNLSLRWLDWNETASGEKQARVAVSNSSPTQSINAKLTVFEALSKRQVGESLDLLIEEKGEQIINVPLDEAAQNIPLLFQLEGDAMAFDNALHAAPTFLPSLSIGLVSSSSAGDPEHSPYFISKAVGGFNSPLTTIESETPFAPAVDSYIVDRPLLADEAQSLRAELEKGKTALLLASSIELSDTIKTLTSDSSWGMDDREPGYLLVGEVDFKHSLFAPFADPRFSNFASIRNWETIQITVPENEHYTVIARFDDGTPLLTETKVGEGSLFIWAGSWAPSKSQWVLSSKFIPFLHRFALLASGGPSLPSNLELTHANTNRYGNLLPEAGPSNPGIYRVEGSAERWLAFQASGAESRTSVISTEQWDQLGLPELTDAMRSAQIASIAETTEKESMANIEKRQHLWQWLLWLVLALLAGESFAAIKLTKKREVAA